MGKAIALPAALILVLAAMVPQRSGPVAHAQSSITLPCSAQPVIAPMQGHYTGSWHSDGDYHFITMGYDVELKVSIDGTLDLTVGADGAVTGTATGTVNAPVYDNGQQDVSSGTGTISASVTGTLSGGSLLVLNAPVIDMHWGTFVGGGYTIERFITMPSYQLAGPAGDCISAAGSIQENGFPVQTIIADGAGQMAQVPGVGTAGGTWQITSAASATFQELSARVDSFINAANAVLAGGSLTPHQVNTQVVEPLHDLEATISANPDVARCLLERLGAWERSAVTGLLARASSATPTGLAQMRSQGDLLRVFSALNTDCALPDGGAAASLQSAELGALRASVASRDWPQVALLAREFLLWHGSSGQSLLQNTLDAGLHTALQSATDARALLEVARAAYVFSDDADATAAYKRLTASSGPARPHALSTRKKKKGTKKRPRPKPTPTATPQPVRSLEQVLTDGVAGIKGQAATDGTLSWSAVSGADRYVLAVSSGGHLTWTWAGTATSVTYGDTSLAGVDGSADDGWSTPLEAGSTWTVIALDHDGAVVGIKLR